MQWSSAPPNDAAHVTHELVRTPKKGKLRAWIISRELDGCYTHFLGRTLPCLGDLTCPACEQGHARKWYGYLAIKPFGSPTQQILELPAGACLTLGEYVAKNTQLRGKIITCERKGGRPNGRVQISLEASEAWPETAPEPIDTRATLLRIWRVDESRIGPQIATKTDEHTAALRASINGRNTAH